MTEFTREQVRAMSRAEYECARQETIRQGQQGAATQAQQRELARIIAADAAKTAARADAEVRFAAEQADRKAIAEIRNRARGRMNAR